MPDLTCHTLVLGAGPGGYVCAIRAGQLGLDTVLVEAVNEGGTCLNVGCIPSKAIIHAAEVFHQAAGNAAGSQLGIKLAKPKLQYAQTLAWKNGIVDRLTGGVRGLLKKHKVRTIKGWGQFVDGKTVDVHVGEEKVRIRAKHIVIATGSRPMALPGIPFGGLVSSSTELLSASSIPKQLTVVGAGYIGLELGIAFAKLGSAVTVLEAAGQILPRYDRELVAPIARRLEALGVSAVLDARVQSVDEAQGVIIYSDKDGNRQAQPTDRVLMTIGRAPVTEGWGREALELEMQGPFIRIDEGCRTSMRDIYAIGDVTGEPMLAHRAMAQGEMVAESIAGQRRTWDKRAVPAVCFTDPEIVTAGLLPEEARTGQGEVTVSSFPFLANGRAMTMERDDGFIRIVSRKEDGLVLGIQAVGHGVSELAASFALALEMGATLEDIAGTVHAHPTLGEAFLEAALKGLGHPLHI